MGSIQLFLVNNYEFTDKQKGIFSKADLFIYNGSTDEKQLAKDFISNNRRLQIIDVAYGLRYKYAPEELWLSPNNALMLVSNIRDNLKTFIDSKFANEEINENYRNLEEILSLRDAEIRSIAKTAAQNGHNTLIVSSNSLKFTSSSPFSPFVTLANGSILHKFTSLPLFIIHVKVSMLSGVGFVFGIGHMVVNPPFTALFDSVSIVPLCSNPGSLK